MDAVFSFFKGIVDLGAAVMLPIVLIIIGLFFRMKLGQAIKSGLMVGIGFQGLCLVVNLLTTSIQPVIKYYQTMGSGFTTTDLGFAAVGAASWSVPFAPIVLPLIVIVNLILLKLKWTKVMNVDIWNYIHFIIPGAMAYALTDSIAVGIIVTLASSVLALFIGQIVAKPWQEFFGLEGTTCSTLSYIGTTFPLATLFNKIIDCIPGLNKIDVNMDKIESKLGFFGDPAVIGVVVGVLLGIITKQDIGTTLSIGMGVSAVLILIPRMVTVMMEGLTALGNAASAYMKSKMGDDAEIYIGMDIALGLGDPCCITSTVIAIPCVILMAFIIPNMTYFPIGLLTIVCYVTPMCVMASTGNLFRSIVTTILCLFLVTFLTNFFAPEATLMMKTTGVHISGMVTDGFFGQNPICILIGFIHRIIG